MNTLYNDIYRSIDGRLLVYFKSEPTILDKDNYLIRFDVLEELGSSSSDNPVGSVSANELSFTLYNDNGLFSPSNVSSAYYGLMKTGLRVIAQVKPSEQATWDNLGEFFVNDWKAELTGMTASVTCYDRIHKILNTKQPVVYAESSVSVSDAYTSFYNNAGAPYRLTSLIEEKLPWWYTLSNSVDTLKNLAAATLSTSYCGRDGVIDVLGYSAPQELAATISDNDQVKAANVTDSLLRDYDGLTMTINAPQLSLTKSLLNLQTFIRAPGQDTSEFITFSDNPVAIIESVTFESPNSLCSLNSYEATTDSISFITDNLDVIHNDVNISVYGKIIESVKTVYRATGDDSLSFDNSYGQTPEIVSRVETVLERFINSQMPVLSLDIRGNPTLLLGSKVQVISDRYNINFTGIVQQATYRYDGSLSGTMTLVDSKILEVT